MTALATSRPHVLIAAVPGSDATRIAMEAAVAARHAVLATSPADADVLVVGGAPGAELAAAVDIVWAQLPGPRARVQTVRPDEATVALETAVRLLQDIDAQRADAAARNDATSSLSDSAEAGEMDGTPLPGGLGMADRAEDRDGLSLDVLHVRLGPVLPGWPAGLAIDVDLQGDVIQHADGRFLPTAPADDTVGHLDGPSAAVNSLDSLAQLLVAADWPAAASEARTLRDDVLRDPDHRAAASRLARLSRRLRRSRTLAARGGGLAVVATDHPEPDVRGDVTARWNRWLEQAADALAEFGTERSLPLNGSAARVALACDVITGLDLGAARLAIASLDLRAPSVLSNAQQVGR